MPRGKRYLKEMELRIVIKVVLLRDFKLRIKSFTNVLIQVRRLIRVIILPIIQGTDLIVATERGIIIITINPNDSLIIMKGIINMSNMSQKFIYSSFLLFNFFFIFPCQSNDIVVLNASGHIEKSVGPFSHEFFHDIASVEKYIEQIKQNPNRYDPEKNMGFSFADWEQYLKNLLKFETNGYHMQSKVIANIKFHRGTIVDFYSEYHVNNVDTMNHTVKTFINPNYYLLHNGNAKYLYTTNDQSYEFEESLDATVYDLPEVFCFLIDYYNALKYLEDPAHYGFETVQSEQFAIYGRTSYTLYDKIFNSWKPIYIQIYGSNKHSENIQPNNSIDIVYRSPSSSPVERAIFFSYDTKMIKTSLIPNSILHIQNGETVIEKIILEINEIMEENTDHYFQLPEDKMKSIPQ